MNLIIIFIYCLTYISLLLIVFNFVFLFYFNSIV